MKTQKFDVERFNIRKLSELRVRKQYQIKIPKRFTSLENLMIVTWENIKENIKISAKESVGLDELKQHEPWFDEECS